MRLAVTLESFAAGIASAVGGGGAQHAEAIERLNGRESVHRLGLIFCGCGLCRGLVGTGGRGQRAECRNATNHLDEQARDRQVGPIRVGGDVEEDDLAGAERRGGDQRRAVLQAGPDFDGGLSCAGSASTCRLMATSFGTVSPANRLLSSKGASGCGFDHDSAPPSVRPPILNATGKQVVAAAFQRGSGKADEHAAALRPRRDAVLHVAGERADVGQHEYARFLLQSLVNALGEIVVLGADDLGIGLDGFLDVVERSQQGLRLLLAFARDQADALPLRAAVEQADGAGGMLARDFEARDLISQFERQFE